MINQFLATLDNNATPPDMFLWPSFTPRVISGDEKSVRDAIIGANLSRQQLFSRVLQLASLVAQSPLAPYITALDPRLTYNESSVRNRFGVSGTAVVYTGSRGTPPTVSLVLSPTTPDVVTYGITVTSSTTATVTDDNGGSVSRTFAYSGGMAGPISSPNGAASFIMTGVAPTTADSWAIGYQKPGASWVEQALARMGSAPCKSVLTPDLLTWFTRSEIQLDKLAAVITGLATR